MLVKVTEDSQRSPNGLAYWDAVHGEFYVEQVGVVACALQESLVQDYDGLIRIAPSIPPGWDFRGSVFVRGKTKIDVEAAAGTVVGALIEAGSSRMIQLRNPWPGEAADILADGIKLIDARRDPIFSFRVLAGKRYTLKRSDRPLESLSFEPLSAAPATDPKKLGNVRIGIDDSQ